MHVVVDSQGGPAEYTGDANQEPGHQAMGPVWRSGVSIGWRSTVAADLGEGSFHKGTRGGDGEARLPDLRHGGRDQMGLDS